MWLKLLIIFILSLAFVTGGLYLVTRKEKRDAKTQQENILSLKVAPLPTNSPSSEITPTLIETKPEQTITPTLTQPQPTQTETGLIIEDLKAGEGREVKKGDIIQIHYVGTLTNGVKFDSSYDRGQPLETQIGVGQVIPGWDEGVIGMRIGGKRRLTIPPTLAYGAQGSGDVIPPNATLIFEVELVNIK